MVGVEETIRAELDASLVDESGAKFSSSDASLLHLSSSRRLGALADRDSVVSYQFHALALAPGDVEIRIENGSGAIVVRVSVRVRPAETLDFETQFGAGVRRGGDRLRMREGTRSRSSASSMMGWDPPVC